MAANGLSLKTAAATVAQLASERTADTKWRRASILDRLQWDLFRANYKRLKPAFSTFFLNSTAHYQHYHWREMEPDAFTLKPEAAERERMGDAILYGYQQMDEIVGECLDFAKDEATIVLCTALGQQPLTAYEDEGGKQVFRLSDPARTLKIAGVGETYEYRPVMAEEFQLKFASAALAEAALAKVLAVTMDDGRRLFSGHSEEEIVFLRCALTRPPEESARIVVPGRNEPELFYAHFYPLESIKSGGHHPDGIFWVRTPAKLHRTVERKLSLQEIAPTLLALCRVEEPAGFTHRPTPEIVSAVM